MARSIFSTAPAFATIEVVGTCNLRCPSCPVANMPDEPRTKGFMPVELFERIVAKIKREAPVANPDVWLFNWGEPLLHPELPRIIRTLKANGLGAHVSSNLNIHRGLREAIRAEPDSLKISLSGASPEVYRRGHARGDLHLVKSNLYLLRHLLDRTRAKTRVWVGYHLYRHNLHEREAMRALCAELGFEFHESPAMFHPVEKMIDLIDGKRSPEDAAIIGSLLRDPLEHHRDVRARRSGRYDCELRFNMTTINHDGTVAACCATYSAQAMLGVSFLDVPHHELEAMRYRHAICRQCTAYDLQYTVAELEPNAPVG